MAEKHFKEQKLFTVSYLIPYFEKHLPQFERMKILEIGCAEAGFLDVLHKKGIQVTGLELEAGRVKIAKKKNPQLNIFTGDITDESIITNLGGPFDLIVMRDVIEHIPNRNKIFTNIRRLLNTDGYCYITFPPRFSGFAGHQQNGKTILRMIPYLHLLPDFIIKRLGSILKEKPNVIDAVVENYKIGLSIRKFKTYLDRYNFSPIVNELFLFRPIYQYRFKLRPARFPNIFLLREFFAFGCEYLIKKTD